MKLERLDLRPERLDLRPERLDLRPERPDLRPERPDLRPERPDLRLGRLGKLWRGGRTYVRTDVRNGSPLCPTGHRPFGAAALLSLHFFSYHSKQGIGYR